MLRRQARETGPRKSFVRSEKVRIEMRCGKAKDRLQIIIESGEVHRKFRKPSPDSLKIIYFEIRKDSLFSCSLCNSNFLLAPFNSQYVPLKGMDHHPCQIEQLYRSVSGQTGFRITQLTQQIIRLIQSIL